MSEHPEPEASDEHPAARLDDFRDEVRAREEARGFTFGELRIHRDDAEWLDANPGAREEIERLAETVRRATQVNLPISDGAIAAIREATRGVAPVTPKLPDFTSPLIDLPVFPNIPSMPPADLGTPDRLMRKNPAVRTNELLTTQVEVLKGLVLAQDAQLKHMRAEAEKGEERADQQKADTHRSHTVIVWTLAITVIGILVTLGLGIATLVLGP